MEDFDGGLYITFNGFAVWQGHYIADHISVWNGKLSLLNLSVANVEPPLKIDDADFVAPSSSTPSPPSEMKLGSLGPRIGGQDQNYPMEALADRVQGLVMLEGDISKTGEVVNLRVVSGPKELQQSSYDAVKTWKYKPYLLNGQPIEVRIEINVVYKMSH